MHGERLFRVLGLLTGSLSFKQFNSLGRARDNVAFHYDLPDRLYDFFLDDDRQYSCAYFTDADNTLEQAQQNKARHVASKLMLRPDLSVLDIGSGWGGLGLYLARETGCRVTGVTLSSRQHAISQKRAQAAGLAKLCRFELRDYRLEPSTYDRIVSVGMFEHVGKKNYREFFARISSLLNDDGVCLLHTIVRCHGPGGSNPFIQKHIFPGSDIPALSELLVPIEQSGLFVTDMETLRLHYADTLRHWTERFRAHREPVVALYGEEFFRKWEFYLVGCEVAFRHALLMVAQVQLSKSFSTVPVTRRYIQEWEDAHSIHPSRFIGANDSQEEKRATCSGT